MRDRYYNVQSMCDSVETVSAQRTASCEVEAKLRAIDMAGSVFAVTAGAEDAQLEVALHYARRVGKTVVVLDSDLQMKN